MNKTINISLTGELVSEYLENGMKCHAYYIKLVTGKLIGLDILEYVTFNSDWTVKEYLITSHLGAKLSKTREEAMDYVMKLIQEMGYEVSLEEPVVPINFEI